MGGARPGVGALAPPAAAVRLLKARAVCRPSPRGHALGTVLPEPRVPGKRPAGPPARARGAPGAAVPRPGPRRWALAAHPNQPRPAARVHLAAALLPGWDRKAEGRAGAEPESRVAGECRADGEALGVLRPGSVPRAARVCVYPKKQGCKQTEEARL